MVFKARTNRSGINSSVTLPYPILPTDPCQVSGTLTDDTRSVADQLGVQLAGLSQELQRLSAAKADKVIVCQVEMLKLALILKSL